MELTWSHRAAESDSFEGYDGGWLRAQVVRYDRPVGWQAFLSGHHVDGGPWPSSDGAQASAEAALAI